MDRMMRYRGYLAHIEFDAEDACFVGHIAGIRDIIGFHAETVDELKAAFHEAVDDYLATCAAAGKQPERPFSGRVMFRLPPDLHARAALAAELSGKSMNQWAEVALRVAADRTLERVA